MLRGCSSTRAIISEIVNCRTVDDGLNPTPARNCLQLRIQLVLAKETAIGIVRAIWRILQLIGLDHLVLETEFLNYAVDLGALKSGQAGRLSGDANCAWS